MVLRPCVQLNTGEYNLRLQTAPAKLYNKSTDISRKRWSEQMDMENLIGETTEYDKKAALEVKKPKSWCKSVSAFANTLGGALIFGMADDGQIVGLTEPDSDAEKISEILKTRMEPIPEFRLRFHKTEDGKVLLILDVFKGEETPYYYSGDGTLEAFVRIGNESVRASATELKRIVLRGRNTSYDSQMTLYRVEDYAFSKLRERYKKWTGNSFDNKDLVSFGLADEGGFLTNAGALIADESPIRWSRLFCTRWNGLDKSGGTMDALDDAEYSGSVLSLIENGEAFIKRNARMMWRKTLNLREKLPEYVERSCHEAQINYRQRNRLSGSFVIDAHRERYRKTPTPPTGFSCPLGVFTQVVLGVVFRQSTTASKPLKRRPAIIGRACAGLNCRVNARKSPTL